MPPLRPPLLPHLRLLTRPLITPRRTIHSLPHQPPPPPPPKILSSTLRTRTYATKPPPEPSPRSYTFNEVQTLSSTPTSTTDSPSSTPSRKRILIDVREPAELAATGRIPGAYSMPLTTNPDAFHLSAEDFLERFGFEKPRAREDTAGGGDGGGGEEGVVDEVIFYCKAGVRSRAAARLAREWKGVEVGDFRGGWLDWEGNGGEREIG